MGRRINHHVASLVVLRECDIVAYGLLAAEEGADTVKPECKSSVRRCSELERVNDESELVFGFLLADAEHLEHTALHIGIVNPYASAAELGAVEYKVISVCTNPLEVLLPVGVEPLFVLRLWRGERVVHSIETAVLLARAAGSQPPREGQIRPAS